MSSTFSIESSQLVCDISSLSVSEVSTVSELSSFTSFIYDFIPGGNVDTCGGRHSSFWSPNFLFPYLVLSYFFGKDIARDFIFLLLSDAFSGVTFSFVSFVRPDLFSPVAPDKTDESVRSFSTTISSGDVTYD